MDSQRRLVSSMPPLGRLHLGHYQNTLKYWSKLQHEYECFFCIADWQVLALQGGVSGDLGAQVLDMAIDWLASGISPSSATLLVQSQLSELAELQLLLSMGCPQPWLQRLSMDELAPPKNRAITHGEQSLPLLQVTDVLLFQAGWMPQVTGRPQELEFARSLARRFNALYGQEAGFEERVRSALRKLGRKTEKLYLKLRRDYQEQGDLEALTVAQALVKDQQNITLGDQERLYGYLEGSGKLILPEPQGLFLDGAVLFSEGAVQTQILLRDAPEQVAEKVRRMPTDPARIHRADPGNPDCCPVWQLQRAYLDKDSCQRLEQGCRSAGIGCLECKEPLVAALIEQLAPIRARALEYEDNLDMVRSILQEGSEKARSEARETLQEVRQAMGVDYR